MSTEIWTTKANAETSLLHQGPICMFAGPEANSESLRFPEFSLHSHVYIAMDNSINNVTRFLR